MLILLTCSALFCWLVGFYMLYKIPLCKGNGNICGKKEEVSLIIPARNEAHNLTGLLKSISRQNSKPGEVIVVDDNSTDRTAEVARKHGARVVSGAALPPGWLGKPWACQQGANAAKGTVFFFMDADVFFEDNGYGSIMETFLQTGGVLSIAPYHKTKKLYESFSGFFNMMQMVGMGIFGFNKKKSPEGMFGPCVIIRKEDYGRIGGHEKVKGEVLEHYKMARVLQDHDIPIFLRGGRKSLNTRMYPNGILELIRGWTKSFVHGAENTPKYIVRLIFIWIYGLMSSTSLFVKTLFSVNEDYIIIYGVLFVLFTLQVMFHFRRIGNFSLILCMIYPIPLMFFLIVFGRAGYMAKKGVASTWKGRSINIKEIKNNA